MIKVPDIDHQIRGKLLFNMHFQYIYIYFVKAKSRMSGICNDPALPYLVTIGKMLLDNMYSKLTKCN